jgi:hypothetical protein
MLDRKIVTVDEADVLDRVERVYRRFMERAGLASLARTSAPFWGVSRP